ncbi:MAG: hypothetical protein ACI8UD_000383 [Planctomycetota bacterium]|jgi:hypothetical protein
MKLSTCIPLALAILAAPLASQSAAALKKQLKQQESAAKKDPEALFEAGKWAQEANLEKDAERIFKKVLKLAKDHVGANTELGNQLIDDKWWPEKVAKKMRAKAMQAEYSAKGYKKIDDIWVPPAEVADARKGIFNHEGEKVTRDEKEQLQAGKVRHPATGQLIDKSNLEKANNGYFPLRGTKWGDQKEANQYHSELGRPWIIRTELAQIMSTLPIEKIQDLKTNVTQGIEKASPLFAGRKVSPSKRPLIIIAKTQAEFREYATQLGDGTDVAGAFLIREDAEFTIPGQGQVRPAICENEKDWGQRYIRHAAAIAYVNAIAEEGGSDLPLWFVHGVGSYTSRFENDSDAGWFGKQHVAKGGVSNIKSFLSGFTLSGDLESPKIAFNLFQAGLLLSYATQGGNREVTDAMVGVTDALSGKGKVGVGKAITKLETLLADNQDAIVVHLKKLIAKAP